MGFELEAIARALGRLDDRQRRMIALVRQGFTELGVHMGEIDDRLADLAAAEDGEHVVLARLLVDFEAKAGTLSESARAAFDAIKAHVLGDTTAITDTDPQPTAAEVPAAGGVDAGAPDVTPPGA